ncbi:MAG: protein kinase, partial [Anaerolinea sp.]|nr:protein kinase [Anaerolinea sp.]
MAQQRRFGKYEVVERLGRGGMAEVYRAYHPTLDRYVAIKVLHPFLADDPEFTSRFEKEARHIARLRHENIVQVYDFENDAETETYFMVMELIDGRTLKDIIAEQVERGTLLPLKESLRIVREAAQALAYAHSQKMIHRDVKPANLMIDQTGRVVLTDFGIAKIVTGVQFTQSGGMIGTPVYMSPEQGLGEAGDERSDLYSLGVILFQLVTGRLPYDAETPLAVILKHLNDPIPSARQFNPRLPEAVDRIIERLLAKSLDDRYPNAQELIRDLEQVEGMLTSAAAQPLKLADLQGDDIQEGETPHLTPAQQQVLHAQVKSARSSERFETYIGRKSAARGVWRAPAFLLAGVAAL